MVTDGTDGVGLFVASVSSVGVEFSTGRSGRCCNRRCVSPTVLLRGALLLIWVSNGVVKDATIVVDVNIKTTSKIDMGKVRIFCVRGVITTFGRFLLGCKVDVNAMTERVYIEYILVPQTLDVYTRVYYYYCARKLMSQFFVRSLVHPFIPMWKNEIQDILWYPVLHYPLSVWLAGKHDLNPDTTKGEVKRTRDYRSSFVNDM